MLNIKGKKIAYKSYSSKTRKKMPSVVFLGGFMSNKNSAKANFVYDYCRKNDLNFVCFDYTGHGESSGKLLDGTISSWLEDSLDVIDNLTEREIILIGSSLGGWLSLLVALARPEKIKAIIGIAPSPDFTERLVWKNLTPAQKKEIMNKGIIEIIGGDNGEYKYIFTKNLILDGRKNCILTRKIPIKKPVILLHGYKDKTVSVDTSLKIAKLLESEDVRIFLSKNGDHKMSQKEDLETLAFSIDSLLC